MKKLIAIIMCAVLVLGMSACAGGDRGGSTSESKALDTKSASNEESLNVGDTSDEESSSTGSVSGSEASESDSTDALKGSIPNSEIVNNAGHFVKYGDTVFFNTADAEHMDVATLWCEFMNQDMGGSALFGYDLKEKEPILYFYDNASGPIVISNDKLYCRVNNKTVDDPKFEVMSYNILTDEPKKLPYTELVGVSEDNEIVFCSYYKDASYCLVALKNDEVIFEADIPNFVKFLASDGKNLLYCATDEAYSTHYLFSMDIATQNAVCLGTIPACDMDSSAYGEISQILMDKDTVYGSIAYFAGTGHFYSGGNYFKARIEEENSLELLYPEVADTNMKTGVGTDFAATDEDIDYEPTDIAPFIVKAGKMYVSNGKPNTAGVDNAGRLGYYDNAGNFTALSDGYANEYDTDKGTAIYVEATELVDNYIFIMKNDCQRVPEEDVGWREAYKRVKAITEVVGIDTKKTETVVTVESASN